MVRPQAPDGATSTRPISAAVGPSAQHPTGDDQPRETDELDPLPSALVSAPGV